MKPADFNNINKVHLCKIAHVVRSSANEMIANGDCGKMGIDSDLAGACGDISLVFAQLTGLQSCFESGSFDGWGHCWIRLPNEEVWDLTATQFNIRAHVHVATGLQADEYKTMARGRPAIGGLRCWADPKWRSRLRKKAKNKLRKAYD